MYFDILFLLFLIITIPITIDTININIPITIGTTIITIKDELFLLVDELIEFVVEVEGLIEFVVEVVDIVFEPKIDH